MSINRFTGYSKPEITITTSTMHLDITWNSLITGITETSFDGPWTCIGWTLTVLQPYHLSWTKQTCQGPDFRAFFSFFFFMFADSCSQWIRSTNLATTTYSFHTNISLAEPRNSVAANDSSLKREVLPTVNHSARVLSYWWRDTQLNTSIDSVNIYWFRIEYAMQILFHYRCNDLAGESFSSATEVCSS